MENLIRNHIRDNHKVLEIAAGTGRHSKNNPRDNKSKSYFLRYFAKITRKIKK